VPKRCFLEVPANGASAGLQLRRLPARPVLQRDQLVVQSGGQVLVIGARLRRLSYLYRAGFYRPQYARERCTSLFLFLAIEWTLRPWYRLFPRGLHRFLCPRCRAGLCDRRLEDAEKQRRAAFLCSRCRAGLCDSTFLGIVINATLFLCPRCRAGLCDIQKKSQEINRWRLVSMPSMSGGTLRCRRYPLVALQLYRFYALDVGRDFAMDAVWRGS
jgi:hypothetical protein